MNERLADVSSRPATSRGISAVLSGRLLEALFDGAAVVRVPVSHVLRARGDRLDACHLLRRGLLKSSRYSPAGRERIVRVYCPGDLVGVHALLEGTPSTTTIETLTACDLLRIEGPAFLEAVHKVPAVEDALVRQITGDLCRDGEALLAATVLDAGKRLEQVVLQLCERLATGAAAGVATINLPLGQSDLAAMAGISREGVSRILGNWKRKGIIERKSYRHYAVHLAALRGVHGLVGHSDSSRLESTGVRPSNYSRNDLDRCAHV
jgi:CRP/FNR family transcriptional regulator, cyclic AMP receptor protein